MGIAEEVIDRLKSSKFWLVMLTSIATALGSFGGFPEPPAIFVSIAKSPVVQWFLMFILILQGGSGFDFIYALLATGMVFLLYKVVSMINVSAIVKQAALSVAESASQVAGPAIAPSVVATPGGVERFHQQGGQMRQEHYQEEMDIQEMPEEFRNKEQFNPAQESSPSGYGGNTGYQY